MSGTPNYTFSIERGREVSSFEASLDSLKRRFSTSMGKNGRRSGQENEAGMSGVSNPPRRMPKSKDRYVDVNGDKGRSVNNNRWSVPTDTSDNDGVLSADGSGNDYGHNNSKSNSSVNHRDGRNIRSQSNLSLGPYTEAANQTLQHMSETQKALQVLSDLCKKQVREIEEVSITQAKCVELEKLCKKQKERISVLKDMDQEKEEEFAQEKEDIRKEREGLKAEKENLEKLKEAAEKRARMQEAEQKNKQEKELEKLKKDEEKQYETLKQNLERDMKKQEDEVKNRLIDLETTNKNLFEQVKEQEAKIEAQELKLTNAKDEYDVLRRAKDSFKEEKQKLEKELKMMNNEFALNGERVEFYEENFHKISEDIEEISLRYFKDLDDDDFDTIREKLIAVDKCFASVPISDTEESQSLRIAHAQRVISSSLHNNIWQPFSSDKTLPHPDFVSLLCEIAEELAKPSPDGSTSGRTANFWTASAMRALRSLSLTSPSSPTSTAEGNPPRPPLPRRADKVVTDVFGILSPLVNPSQEAGLQKELTALADRAISIWYAAQTDELQFTVLPTLDRAHRDEWRYARLDSSQSAGKDTETETIPSTRPRIYRLFPRVIATQKAGPTTEPPSGPPGSWPAARDEPRSIEICVHNGVGLPEWSPVVVRGRAEQEEKEEALRKEDEEIEKIRLERWEKLKQANTRVGRRNSGQSRRDSMAGSISGPPSPTQLKWDGGMMTRTAEE